jgi:hypothetical protein
MRFMDIVVSWQLPSAAPALILVNWPSWHRHGGSLIAVKADAAHRR